MTTVLASVLLVSWALLEFGLRHGDAARSWDTASEDRGTTRLIVGTYVVLTLVTIMYHRVAAVRADTVVAWVGIMISASGLALRTWAMQHLGRYYSRTLRVQNDQRIVDDGPYRHVRHPGYLGSILVWTGAELAINAILAVFTAIALIVVYTRRIDAEEAMLSAWNPQYRDYQRHSRRLIPGVW
jgi:protein-S-isoprenylcysteine O-methyltransferase Ste14